MTAAPPPQRIHLAGLGFDLACALYFVTLGPFVAATSHAVMREQSPPVPWLGLLLLALVVAETWALPKKMALVRSVLTEEEAKSGFVFILWILHSGVAVIVLFLALGSFGWSISGVTDSESPSWIALTIPGIVIKELYLLSMIFNWGGKSSESGSEAPEPPDPNGLREVAPSAARSVAVVPGTPEPAEAGAPGANPCSREPVLDGILLLNACVLFSATWGAFFRGAEAGLSGPNLPMLIANGIAGMILFTFLYLPLRIPYWTEAFAKADRERFGWLKVGLSLLSAMVPALLFL